MLQSPEAEVIASCDQSTRSELVPAGMLHLKPMSSGVAEVVNIMDIVGSVVKHNTVNSCFWPIKSFQGIINMISDVCPICSNVNNAHPYLGSPICQASFVWAVLGC